MTRCIPKLLEAARSDIDVASALIGLGHFRVATTRAYYAMFYVAEALLAFDGLTFSSHSAVIGGFGKQFAKTQRLAPAHHRRLIEAFDRRGTADYELEPSPTREQAEETLSWAHEFLAACEAFLKHENGREA